MKKFFLSFLLFPVICTASNSLEFEFIRTIETPGFFAITIFPTEEKVTSHQDITFVKNFIKEEAPNYEPVIQFLTEIGAKITDTLSRKEKDTRIVSIGEPIIGSKNFQLKEQENALEQFEQFSLQNLKPVFFRNLRAEFGGNISSVTQPKKNIVGDQSISFIGKFDKNMRTRMLVVSDDKYESIEFEAPLDFTDLRFSQPQIAAQLPNMWEQLQQKENTTPPLNLSILPWIIGSIVLLILVTIFIRYTQKRYKEFLEQQSEEENIHEELPWKTISSAENKLSNNPFEIE